ncbi:MFS transporter [Pseudonocardia sp. WMMC193]|uniref:MFS transporter n=1 Tax=Pseudonocardia sp. WMMC193 TaxID=2911965 RepID=UPI001F165AD9|nr:MFS transporter [Pseudonocardia sp. WMMC193]MCF7549469.1 MHS family MFS transporter [Pseudonocardia sp. WMMC193]
MAFASLVGTTIEYYDFSVYAMAASLALGPLFFPSGSGAASTLAAFATFAVAFIARPLGSIVFSTIGDRVGRRRALLICLLLMGCSTVAIGLLPTYAAAGAIAPILLVVCRILQGLAVGGEWGGAVLLATEHAPPNRRAFFGAFPQIGPPLGFVLAALIFSVTTAVSGPEGFLVWGWRVPFLLSVVMVGVGLWVRLRVEESPVFDAAASRDELVKAPLIEVFRRYPGRILIGMCTALGGLTTWFLITTFSVSYGTAALGIGSQTMILVVCAAAATHGVLVLPAALVVERFGRRIPMMIGAVGVAVCVVPAFALLSTRNPVLIGLGFCVTMVPFTLIFGPVGAWLAELFPTRVRYVGASTGFMLASLLGGFSPLVGSALLAGGRPPVVLGAYAGVLALLGVLALAFSPETKNRSLLTSE